MPTDKIRALDMRLIDDLFGMGGGYVLDFSDRTFAEFFSETMKALKIDSPMEARSNSPHRGLVNGPLT